MTLLTPPADTNDTTPTFSGGAGDATGDSSTVTVKVYGGTDTSGTLLQTRNATRTGATWTIDAVARPGGGHLHRPGRAVGRRGQLDFVEHPHVHRRHLGAHRRHA